MKSTQKTETMSGQHNNGDGGNANNIPVRTLQVGPIGIDVSDWVSNTLGQFYD